MSGWRRLRVLYQVVFLALFLWLFERLAAGDPRALPFGLFQHADPLTAAGLALAHHAVPVALGLSFVIIVLTVLFGRVFCGWICPLGTLQEYAARWLVTRKLRTALKRNRWRGLYTTKYLILAFLAGVAVLGSFQAGLLDPLSLLPRALAASVWPVLPGHASVPGGWLAGGLLVAIILGSLWAPRLFCRAFCPLGALLGLLARVSVFRIRREEGHCTSCNLCVGDCQGAAEPLGEHRVEECLVCLDCIDACPDGAISYGLAPVEKGSRAVPDLSRRRVLGTVVTGLAVGPVLMAAGGGRAAGAADLIRPPGAEAEDEFLDRCVKCMLCEQACPTGVIQPALGQAGIEGFWTPVLRMRRGWCEYNCTRCGEECPTGAIRPLTLKEKIGQGRRAPVRIGTAFLDRGRCLPWGMSTPCIVCEEMCPTDPKAIWLEELEGRDRDGRPVRLQRPHVDPSRCVGCGICENRCPVGERAAIRVSSAGESRNPANRMLVGGPYPG